MQPNVSPRATTGGAATLFVGACAGGGLAFLFDPARGRTRRALLRDRLVRLTRQTEEAAETASRDLRNRAVGLVAEARHLLDPEQQRDERLRMRVRMALRATSMHPGAITAEVRERTARLSGPILANEAEAVLAAVRSVRGIRHVADALERHDSPGSIPALQGEGRRLPSGRWSPAARALLGLGCAAAAAPLAVRALTSPRVLSMSPALFSGLLGLTSLVMAKQEREAQRRALEADRGDGAAEPAARSREGKAVSTAEEREGAFGEGR